MQRPHRISHPTQTPNAHATQDLGLELIRQDQIRLPDQLLVARHNLLRDIQPSLVTHDRIQDPEEATGFHGAAEAEVAGDGADGMDDFGAGRIAGQEDVEVGQIGLFETRVEILDLVGGRLAALELFVACVITFLTE
jgi:hypothetical protein